MLRPIAPVDPAAPADAQLANARDVASVTDERGHAELRLGIGRHAILATRIGFAPETVLVTIDEQATSDVPIVVAMEELAEELEAVVVSSTRTERHGRNRSRSHRARGKHAPRHRQRAQASRLPEVVTWGREIEATRRALLAGRQDVVRDQVCVDDPIQRHPFHE